ncbi:MAG: response regulator [Acidobacteriota bacterium]
MTSEATPAASASPPLRVLLVEDDEFDVAVFGRAFRQANIPCEIIRCRRGEEVLEGLRDAELAVDLLVTDHLLPGISGFELCVELIERKAPFALVLLTGGGTEQMAIRALRAGINDYIVKDSAQEYLELLPLVLPKVARRHRERQALRLAAEQQATSGEGETPQELAGDGSAIGLSVCAAMVRQRGGRIWVEGSGSVQALHFAVPLTRAEAEAWRGVSTETSHSPIAETPESTTDVAIAHHPVRLHILIAHPNPIVTFVATRSLERLGHRTVAVSDGNKAAEAIDREPFDLLLMAAPAPRGDTLEATRRIRQHENAGGHLPIIALAVGSPEDAESCLEAGMDEQIPRPIGFESLGAAVMRLAHSAPPA